MLFLTFLILFWQGLKRMSFIPIIMECEICKKNIETTFLGKILGTIIKDKKGKKHFICKECQSKDAKEELLKKL